MKRVSVDVSGVNFKLLREQKEVILNLRCKLECKPTDKERTAEINALSGILHLIDSIQDQAAEQLPTKQVFETDP